MSDLITRLSAELDRREEWLRSRDGHRNPDDGGYYSCAAVREYSIDGEPTGSDAYCDCGYVAQREGELRLIEAHRKILARYVKVDAELHAHAARVHAGEHIDGEARVRSEAHMWQHMALYEVVRHLARGYGLTTEEGA